MPEARVSGLPAFTREAFGRAGGSGDLQAAQRTDAIERRAKLAARLCETLGSRPSAGSAVASGAVERGDDTSVERFALVRVLGAGTQTRGSQLKMLLVEAVLEQQASVGS